MVIDYKKSEMVRRIFKMFLNLAFVPIEKIKSYFDFIEQIISKNRLLDKFERFLNYFKRTYYNNEQNLESTLFHIEFWSAHLRVCNDIQRTTNSVEAWHNSLNSQAFIAHPNIAKFIDLIKKADEKSFIN
jgi:hypothetical protein